MLRDVGIALVAMCAHRNGTDKIKSYKYLETNSFELSIIAIILFSLIAVAFPALVFKFLFGEDKRYWRRKLYFLIRHLSSFF